MDNMEYLMFDNDIKDNVPVVLRGERRLNLVGERLGWTIQYNIEYKRKVLNYYSAYDYGDALERANKLFDEYVKVLDLLDEVSIGMIIKIDNIKRNVKEKGK